jgi:serine/threonine-protein kinase
MSTAVESCDVLLQTLTQQGLLDRSGLETAQAFQESSPGRSPADLVGLLVGKGHLTPFQAEALLRGAAGNLVLSQYLLVDVIGTGSMGTVYKGRAAKSSGLGLGEDDWYAIKIVPRKNVVNLKAVAEKVEALKQVRHPRVSAMIHVGAQGDRVYMVWPMLGGGVKLNDVIARQGKLPARKAGQVALQIASGLLAYHQHDLFHGLLKASDILIGTDRRVRILDFGVGFLLTCERGKSLLSTTTNGKAMARGLDCASPESIIDPLQRTAAGDQYSLGCILYLCLTGQYPHPSDNPVKKMLGHQFEEPTPIRQLAPETPHRLEAIVRRLLAKTPQERYPTIEEAVSELQAVTAESRNAVPVKPVPASASVKTPSGPKRAVTPSAIAEKSAKAKSKTAASPKTARESRAGLWLTLAALAVGSAIGVLSWLLTRG